MRHHYTVTTRGLEGADEQWFHTFAEADARVADIVGAAREKGDDVADHGYWRERLGASGAGSAIELALDDAGLVPCGPRCGG